MQKHTPLEDGFTMPFEGDKHKGTIILLPYRKDTWENGGEVAMESFLDIVKAISNHAMVYVVADPSINEKIVNQFKLNNVEILRIKYNDSWARDNTLIYVKKGKQIRAVDFGFNAWGGIVDGLYKNYFDDELLGDSLIREFKNQYYALKSFILEGGSIHTNGKGTMITTEACLLSKGRNSSLSKNQIETTLKEYLGQNKVIWLPHGIVDDETNEHVDNFACFLDETTVLLAMTKDKSDLQYEYSMQALEILKNETTWDGKPLKVITIPVPDPYLKLTQKEANNILPMEGAKLRKNGDRLAGSYVNFYQGKDYIILPKFNVDEDLEAYKILKDFYPNKTIYQIESRSILVAGGNIHCVTMQIPTEE